MGVDGDRRLAIAPVRRFDAVAAGAGLGRISRPSDPLGGRNLGGQLRLAGFLGTGAVVGRRLGSSGYLIQAKGFVDSIIVTAHVATGSLILAVSTLLVLRILRVRDRRQQAQGMHWDADAANVTSSAALGS